MPETNVAAFPCRDAETRESLSDWVQSGNEHLAGIEDYAMAVAVFASRHVAQ
jgi:hypothetical protein